MPHATGPPDDAAPRPTMSAATCPRCGIDAVHLGSVRVFGSDRVLVIGGDLNLSLSTMDRRRERGSTVEVLCWCEAGHRWWRRLAFDKGTTHEEILPGGDWEPGIDHDPPELWRDA